MKQKHYSPAINRFLVSALYYEAQSASRKNDRARESAPVRDPQGWGGKAKAIKQLDQQAQGITTP